MARVFTVEDSRRSAYHAHTSETLVSRYDLSRELVELYKQLDWTFDLDDLLSFVQMQFGDQGTDLGSFEASNAIPLLSPARVHMSAQYLSQHELSTGEKPKISWIPEGDDRANQFQRLVNLLQELSQLCCTELPHDVLSMSPNQCRQK